HRAGGRHRGRAGAAGKHSFFCSRFGAGGTGLRVGMRAGKPRPGLPADVLPGRPGMGVDPMKNAYITRSTDLAYRMFAGQTIIISPRDSTLLNLNETASANWEAADPR